MKFTFFTLGGMQLWEDLFFYQGWRIQKNCITGRYRLLDAWDIRRESGTLSRCQNSFIRYIEVCQLLRPKEKAVLFLHGFCGTKDSFKEMAQTFESGGYTPIAINCPTTRRTFHTLVEQVEFLLKNLKDVKEMNFVVYGFGGLILRKMFSKSSAWKRKFKIGKIVAIDVPNRGNQIGESINRSIFLKKIFGPATEIYDSDNVDILAPFPKNVDIGVITTWNPIFRLISGIIPQKWKENFASAKESHIDNAKEILPVKYFRINPCKNKKLITYCINFIKNNKFKSR